MQIQKIVKTGKNFDNIHVIAYLCSQMEKYKEYKDSAIELLKVLISTPSVSREEQQAADKMENAMRQMGLSPQRQGNNLWVVGKDFDKTKPTILLNAHIDTVKPVASWTRNPFEPTEEDGCLYGLGSNDCGGGLVSLLQVFRILQETKQAYNLVYLASAEEEVAGKDGIASVLPLLPEIAVAVVGEPTGMQPAIAERGLMVLDIKSYGRSGHAARNEGINAIEEALDDIHWIVSHKFRKESPLLGPTQMKLTMIHSGTQHNVVPDLCEMVVDVRTNEYYRNEYVYEYVKKHLKSEVTARSFRLNSSYIDPEHPIVKRCVKMGMKPYGSPTLSDQSQMSFPSIKLGPGESARSHTADEYIRIDEIEGAIDTYVRLLDGLSIAQATPRD